MPAFSAPINLPELRQVSNFVTAHGCQASLSDTGKAGFAGIKISFPDGALGPGIACAWQ